MRAKLDLALVIDFPRLYRDRDRDTAMCWGFECGDGWEPLIRRLSETLEPMVGSDDDAPRAIQVKEKFGTLSFYMTKYTTPITKAIGDACQESARTCEECSRPGFSRGGSWISTLCDECYQPQ